MSIVETLAQSLGDIDEYLPKAPPPPPDQERRWKWIDGQWVEMKMGVAASWIGARLVTRLGLYAEQHGGDVFGADCGYEIFPHRPGKRRFPDVSFIKSGRLPENFSTSLAVFRIVPDLAIEAVSPNDLAEEINQRIDDYIRAGVPLLWVISPRLRTAQIHRANGSVTMLRHAGELSGEDVLPGLSIPFDFLWTRLADEKPESIKENGHAR